MQSLFTTGMDAIDKIGSAFLRRILRRMKELGGEPDGAGAADGGVAAVYHEGAAAGRELFVPDGGETCGGAEDGFLPGTQAEGRKRAGGRRAEGGFRE